MAFAKTLINEKLTLDEWNKFQAINFGLCVGLRPIKKEGSQSVLFTSFQHGGGFSVNQSNMPSSLAVYCVSQSKQHFNELCNYDEDMMLEVDKLIAVGANLKEMDLLKDKTPLQYTKELVDYLTRTNVHSADYVAEFLNIIQENYELAVKMIADTTWGENIAKALHANLREFKDFKENVVAVEAEPLYN